MALRYDYKGGGAKALAELKAGLDHFTKEDVPKLHWDLQRSIILRFYDLVSQSNPEMPHHPVDTSWAQSNWRVSITTPKTNTVGTRLAPHRVKKSNEIKWQLDNLISFAKGGGFHVYKKVWIFNNVPYMAQLENGTSRMAPVGIVRPALIEIQRHMATL